MEFHSGRAQEAVDDPDDPYGNGEKKQEKEDTYKVKTATFECFTIGAAKSCKDLSHHNSQPKAHFHSYDKSFAHSKGHQKGVLVLLCAHQAHGPHQLLC